MDEKEIRLTRKAGGQLQSFLTDCKIEKPENKKIFEVGYKYGLFLNECRKAGLEPSGVEIREKPYRTVKSKYPDLNVLWYDGGTIPVSDESFDYVVSFQVLEHVSSLEHVFNECIRILNPGGIMYHVCPNYHSFYEGHKKLLWLPFLNKSLGRLYLKLIRRYSRRYETLNIIKPKIVARALRPHHNDITILSLGRKEFIKKFNSKQIGKVKQKLLQKFLKMLLKFPFKKGILKFIC